MRIARPGTKGSDRMPGRFVVPGLRPGMGRGEVGDGDGEVLGGHARGVRPA
jgi:hypothetical protein